MSRSAVAFAEREGVGSVSLSAINYARERERVWITKPIHL